MKVRYIECCHKMCVCRKYCIVEMFTVCVGRRKYRLFPQVHLPRNNVKNLRNGYRVSEYLGTKI